MSDDKINVEAKFEFPTVEDASDIDLDAEPVFLVIAIKVEGKDGFESTVKLPLGREVPSVEFAKAAKVLQLVAHSFYHQQYAHLREEHEKLNKGKRDVPPLLEKDQRGS